MKRTPLSIGTTIQAKGGSSYTYIIDDVIGNGASSIVYEGHYIGNDNRSHAVRLKECYPYKYSEHINRVGNMLEWDFNEEHNEAIESFNVGYDKLMQCQKSNYIVHAFDKFYENNTAYIVMDANDGVTFDKDDSMSLREILTTVKLLAHVVREYHKIGYVHLDIKPANFLVYPRPSEHIVLFDCDSITAINDIKSGKVKSVPYSKEWASPEQIQGRINKERPESADIYSIGAILFQKLMGRVVKNEDIGIFADWEFDGAMFDNVNPKIKRLLREIFHKTLAANVKRRYSSVSELIEILEQAVNIICNNKAYLISDYPRCCNHFIGRESELSTLHSAIMHGKHLVFVHGDGGIGKTEFVKKYLEKYSDSFDAISFVRYQGSFDEAINEVKIKHKTEYNSILEALKDACDENTLIVLDNYDVPVDQSSPLEKLISLKAKVIVTTRTDFSEIYSNYAYINLTGLGDSNLKHTFELYSGHTLTDFEAKQLEKIFFLSSKCTFYVELCARLMKRGMYTVPEISSMVLQGVPDLEKVLISKDGAVKKQTILESLYELFRLTDLSATQRELFDYLIATRHLAMTKQQIFDEVRYYSPDKKSERIDALNDLEELGFVKQENNKLIVNDIVYEVINTSNELIISNNVIIKTFLENEFIEPSMANVEFDDEIGRIRLKNNIKCLLSVFSTISTRVKDDLIYLVETLYRLFGGKEEYMEYVWNRYCQYVFTCVLLVTKDITFAPILRIKAYTILSTYYAFQTRISFGEDPTDQDYEMMNKSDEMFLAAVDLIKEHNLFEAFVVDKLCAPYLQMSSQTKRFNLVSNSVIEAIIQINPTRLKRSNFPERDFDICALRNLNYQKHFLKNIWQKIESCHCREESKYTAYNACMRIFMADQRAARILDEEHFDLMKNIYGMCIEMFWNDNIIIDPERIELHPSLPMNIGVLRSAQCFMDALWKEEKEDNEHNWYVEATEENIGELVNSNDEFKRFSLKLDAFSDLENAFKLSINVIDTGNKLCNYNDWLSYSLDCLNPKQYIENCIFLCKPHCLRELLNECARLLVIPSIHQELSYYDFEDNITAFEKEYRSFLRNSIIVYSLLGDEESATEKFDSLMQLSKDYLNCVELEDIIKINHPTPWSDNYFWGTINRLSKLGFANFALPFLIEYVDSIRNHYSIDEGDEEDLFELYGEIVSLTQKAYEEKCPSVEMQMLAWALSPETYAEAVKHLDFYQDIINTYSAKMDIITNSKFIEPRDPLKHSDLLSMFKKATDNKN